MKKIWIAAGLLVSGGLLTSCGLLPTEEGFQEAPIVKEYDGQGYGKTSVIRGNLTESESIDGSYKGTTTMEVLAAGESKVKKVYVKKGTKVSIGDLLVRYYIDSYETQMSETQFKMDKMELQIRQQRELKALDVAKQKKLGSDKSTIQAVREQYDATISSYETELKILGLELQEAKEGIEESDAMSDINGTVAEIEPGLEGATPDADTPIMVIEGKKKNRFEMKTKYASRYKDGDVVKIEVKGQDYDARIKKPSGKENTLYLYPTTTTAKFSTGDKCSLECILNEKQDVLYLPSSTIFKTGDKYVVYIEDKEGIKTMKEIQVGETINHLTEIVSGLKEGDQVITS